MTDVSLGIPQMPAPDYPADVRARLESGTPRLSPFLVMGNSAVRLFRSTLTHSTDSSSPRRIPVSSASITKCTSQGLRAARQ